jgi:hypothetical protein
VGIVLISNLSRSSGFFDASINVVVGYGARAMFWDDNLLAGCSIKTLAPNLLVVVSWRIRRSRTMRDGLSAGASGIHLVADITHAR